ncbi:MAG: hypothetical protein JKY75_00735 [Erythrobacter sp.]|nr:hypothetical protein [Erythrobacter sp.]
MAYVAPKRRVSGMNWDAENLRRNAIDAWAATAGAQPAMIALLWNSGVDR